MSREIEFRCWYYNQMHKVSNIDFRHNQINLFTSDTIPIENGILMQYTGLKDKNGKKIFEGDIVESEYRIFKSTVEWNDSFCGFFPFCNTQTGIFADECEVIGNIYENNLESKGE